MEALLAIGRMNDGIVSSRSTAAVVHGKAPSALSGAALAASSLMPCTIPVNGHLDSPACLLPSGPIVTPSELTSCVSKALVNIAIS